jgi:hypothetical protein
LGCLGQLFAAFVYLFGGIDGIAGLADDAAASLTQRRRYPFTTSFPGVEDACKAEYS